MSHTLVGYGQYGRVLGWIGFDKTVCFLTVLCSDLAKATQSLAADARVCCSTVLVFTFHIQNARYRAEFQECALCPTADSQGRAVQNVQEIC